MIRIGRESFGEGFSLWKVLAAFGLLGILAATLYPSPTTTEASSRTSLLCVVCGSDGGVDVLLNIVLFLPFAVGLRLSGVPAWKVILGSALLSLSVETLQYAGVPGRDASLSDLLTNTLGGIVGAMAGPLIPVALFPTPRVGYRLLLLGAALWLGVIGLSAWLMTPWVPAGAIRSYWPPDGPGLDPFHGRVVGAAAEGTSLPLGQAPDSAAQSVRHRLREERLDLTVHVVSGPPPEVRAWIYLIEVGPIVLPLLRQEGTGLYLSIPTRSLQLRLRAPTLALQRAFPQDPGVQVLLHPVEMQRRLRLSSSFEGLTQTSEVQLSPAQGWMLIAPFGISLDRHEPLVTGLYLALFLLPLGYWAAHSGAVAGALGVLAGALGLGLGLLPFWFGFLPVPWSEWAAALAGVAAGWALYRPAAYLETRCASPSISEFSSS